MRMEDIEAANGEDAAMQTHVVMWLPIQVSQLTALRSLAIEHREDLELPQSETALEFLPVARYSQNLAQALTALTQLTELAIAGADLNTWECTTAFASLVSRSQLRALRLHSCRLHSSWTFDALLNAAPTLLELKGCHSAGELLNFCAANIHLSRLEVVEFELHGVMEASILYAVVDWGETVKSRLKQVVLHSVSDEAAAYLACCAAAPVCVQVKRGRGYWRLRPAFRA
jgi:hypothetical protein